ncbi:MAG: hypothetical protein ABI606_00995, partial [Rhodoferax sp.]
QQRIHPFHIRRRVGRQAAFGQQRLVEQDVGSTAPFATDCRRASTRTKLAPSPQGGRVLLHAVHLLGR